MRLSTNMLRIGMSESRRESFAISLKKNLILSIQTVYIFHCICSGMKCNRFYRVAIPKINWTRPHPGKLVKHSSFSPECPAFAETFNSINWLLFEKLNISSDNSEDLDDSTTLKVHFKDITCIKYRRDMYMTWDGLFGKIWFQSNC